MQFCNLSYLSFYQKMCCCHVCISKSLHHPTFNAQYCGYYFCNIYFLIWLFQALVAARGIFHCSEWAPGRVSSVVAAYGLRR